MKRGNWRGRRSRRPHHHHHPHPPHPHDDGSDWSMRNRPTDTPESSDTSSGSDAASSSRSNAPAPELPGFYFDPEKNRYFRLLPGHNNCNPLTRETLEKKERERKRTKLLAEDERARKKAPRTGLNSTLLLQRRRLGELSPSSYCRLVHEVKVSEMKRHKLEVQSADSSSPNADNFRLIVADSACERVFTVNDVSHGGCKYGIMNFSGCRNGSLSAQMCDNLYFTNRKVNSVCWASVTHSDSHVLLCLVGISQTPGCVSLLPASLFSNSNPGEIFSMDLRQRGRGRDHSWKSSRFHQDSAVTSVRLLQDENYLLAADMLGKIKLWDVRARRPVRQYDGHHNEYAYLPLHLCEREGLLLAAGQDCYTRLWSLRDGHLLRTIPSPHPAGKDSIPNVVFSSQLGGRRGLPGLLMAVCHDLYYYPYGDYQDGTVSEAQG